MTFVILWSDPPPPRSMTKYRGGVQKSEKIFFAFLDELDHSKHLLKKGVGGSTELNFYTFFKSV